MKLVGFFTLCLFLSVFQANAESIRVLIAGKAEVSPASPAGTTLSLGINESALVSLGTDTRFFRGVELELSAPQRWLAYQGSLAMAIYADLDRAPASGVAELECRRIAYEPLPGKLKIVYQLPVRSGHGLRTTPYASVPAGITLPASFPVLFRLMPVMKGLSQELETMAFQCSVKPILSDEGAIKLSFRFPEQLRGKPFTALIDDVLIENPGEERLLKEGEHHLVILSDSYRNESRRFMVERAKTLELIIELKDPTPLITFEGPENTKIFLDNTPVLREREPIPVEPGIHEAKFQVGDYTIIKTLNIQRGKTYRVALAVDINVQENE
jgi:hypothetical protein